MMIGAMKVDDDVWEGTGGRTSSIFYHMGVLSARSSLVVLFEWN